MKLGNRLWGSRRIANELKKVSIDVSHTAIGKLITSFYRDGTLKPTGSWGTFVKSHWDSLFACDFFTADVFGSLKRFHVFFIIELATRKIAQYCCTDHPNIAFLRNQLSYFSERHPNARLIHDNSGELKHFPYAQYDIKGVATVPYAPNMNAYAERFVRNVREDCLDHFIIFNWRQLNNIVGQYVRYYNAQRPHMGLGGKVPAGQTPPPEGSVVISRSPCWAGCTTTITAKRRDAHEAYRFQSIAGSVSRRGRVPQPFNL